MIFVPFSSGRTTSLPSGINGFPFGGMIISLYVDPFWSFTIPSVSFWIPPVPDANFGIGHSLNCMSDPTLSSTQFTPLITPFTAPPIGFTIAFAIPFTIPPRVSLRLLNPSLINFQTEEKASIAFSLIESHIPPSVPLMLFQIPVAVSLIPFQMPEKKFATGVNIALAVSLIQSHALFNANFITSHTV